MDKVFILVMGKHMQNNKMIQGFTLLEMCLVLCMISMLLMLTPAIFRTSKTLEFESERIVSLIKKAQALSIINRKDINVEVKRKGIVINDSYIPFNHSVVCDEYMFYFNGKGNINMANSISCYYYEWKKQIVMNLGNGNIYVKK